MGLPGLDLAFEILCHQLVAVADPEHRAAYLKQLRVRFGASGGKYARWSAGDNDRVIFLQSFGRDTEGQDFRIHPEFTYFPSDEVAILTT